jgi:hypothetical protein
MSNDRTSPKHRQEPANTTQIDRASVLQRDFYDIALGFVGKSTKPARALFSAAKNTVSPLKQGVIRQHKTPLKMHGTQHAIGGLRGQKSGRIVTHLTRLTGTSG